MNSQEFVIWLKGFTEGVHDFNITPKQWDLMKERLSQVSDVKTPIGVGGWGTPNGGSPIFTTTPGTTGHITIANPQFTTSTATSLPSGSTISYTTNGAPNWYSTNKIDNDSGNK